MPKNLGLKSTILLIVTLIVVPIAVSCKKEASQTQTEKLGEKRTLVILNEGELKYERDIYGWKEGEFFLVLASYGYPWQGEDSIDYREKNGRLWVNGKLCGVDLRNIPAAKIEDPATIVTVLAGPKQLSELDRFPELVGLTFYDFTGVDLPRLSGLKDLRMLSLRYGKDVSSSLVLTRKTDVTSEGTRHLSGLTELRLLDLTYSKIEAEGLACLQNLSKLNMLFLDNADIGNAGAEKLKAFSELRVLDLSSTFIDDRGLRHLAALTKLEVLSLRGTEVSDAGLRHLKGLTNLRVLVLTKTEVSNFGLKSIMSFPNLRVLYLIDTRVTEAGLKRLKENMPKLELYPQVSE